MFWHKFRLDWSYALGELLIVTLGVLIALAVNNWNNERLERAQERDVVARHRRR
jgi:drug/metabolite transporter (DMT)-like permease